MTSPEGGSSMQTRKKQFKQKIIIASNRLPIRVEKRKGKLSFHPSVGGLATALSSVHDQYQWWWVGWSGTMSASKEIESKFVSEYQCHPIFLSKKDVEKYYQGFCNRTLWPLFHYFPRTTKYDSSEWDSYKKVNQVFCDKIVEVADPDDVIWIHDYQLMLLPDLLRKHLPKATIGFFLHIPFPPFGIFRLLPWRKELLNGILGADLIGFHTFEYSNNFLDSILCLLGADNKLGRIHFGNRIIKAGVFPLGIDFQRFFTAGKDPQVDSEIRRLRRIVGKRKVVLSIDRLDYTKGIPERLEAFDAFLENNPQWRGNVTLVLAVTPSRDNVYEYQVLKKEIDELVGRINGKYSTIDWNPILYVHQTLPFHALAAMYIMADVALITPIRDGMNLIAKEYIAASSNGLGVLILSEMAGAARELGEALIVNPNNKQEISDALKLALEMPADEQIVRNTAMQKRLRFYDVESWTRQFFDQLSEIKKLQEQLEAKLMDNKIRNELITDYRKSTSRLLFLDFDGTLVPFAESPNKSTPNDTLLELLKQLAEDPENEVVLITGRDKNTLDKWFKTLHISLVGEHGTWIKTHDDTSWKIIEPLQSDWKKEIRPTLEVYRDRVPDSFIEEKEFSMAWHYRNVKTEEGELQAKELMALLTSISANIDIGVLHGNKVIEIKNVGINKGRAALRFLSKQNPQFILAIGDDSTDESLFQILPHKAYSIKVGREHSYARFNLTSQNEVIPLLNELLKSTMEKKKVNVCAQ
jgi:trehalose 6-phosphate synthase/phosphatase